MEDRILENYLTGLKFNLSDDSGEHPEAIALATMLTIDPVGESVENRYINIQMKVWHSKEVFERGGKPLNGQNLNFNAVGTAYSAELNESPLTMLILARHLQRKMRSMSDDLQNAEAVMIPEYLNTPELQGFLQQFDAVEEMMKQALKGE